MSSFCRMMENVNQTKRFMTDKDQNEIQAVLAVTPESRPVSMQVSCPAIFQEKVSELVLPFTKKNEIFRTLEQLVYAHNENSFQCMLSVLEQKDS